MAERRGMGKGLGAILPESPTAAEVIELPVEALKPNPGQPRTRFTEDGLEALTASIAASGVVQPLLVRRLSDGSYELIAGERRWRAAQKAGLERVPVVVRDSDEADRLEVALIENMVREDLNPVEEAKACAALVEDLGLSKEDLGKRVGRSRSQVSNLIRLLDLPDEVLVMLEEGSLAEGHGRAILQVPGHEERKQLASKAMAGGWTVRRTEEEARKASKGGRSGTRKNGFSAEEAEAAGEVADRIGDRLGAAVRIRKAGSGLKIEIPVADLREAGRLADMLDDQQ